MISLSVAYSRRRNQRAEGCLQPWPKPLKIKQLSYVSYFSECKVTNYFLTSKYSVTFFTYLNIDAPCRAKGNSSLNRSLAASTYFSYTFVVIQAPLYHQHLKLLSQLFHKRHHPFPLTLRKLPTLLQTKPRLTQHLRNRVIQITQLIIGVSTITFTRIIVYKSESVSSLSFDIKACAVIVPSFS